MRIRNQRGVAFPSPVAILSIVAIAMAGITYFATQGEEPTEREVTTVSRPSGTTASETPAPQRTVEPKKVEKKPEPQVVRGEVYVEVYNNSGITGLAGQVAGTAADGRLAGRRDRQLVRHHPQLHGLLPAAAAGGGDHALPRPRHRPGGAGRRRHAARPAHGDPDRDAA